jgi:hypothetical protein
MSICTLTKPLSGLGIQVDSFRLVVTILDPRMNRIGLAMAQGWLGFLEAMKPVLTQVYGSVAAVDNYLNPNYHGYNLMYESCVTRLILVIALLGASPPPLFS